MSDQASSGFDAAAFLASVPHRPGVYRMFDDRGGLLYVGKAKDLRRRLGSYFRKNLDNQRLKSLVSQIQRIELTQTYSEMEALLLENTLIKEQGPRYNILLRDDKSYPYLFLSAHPSPRLGFHRGSRREKGQYFGPYPSASAVRESLQLLQRLFNVRQCDDSFFANRSRPCLQYQIKRCSAPCVGLVSPADYQEEVGAVKSFLNGKNSELLHQLGDRMQQASDQLDFEKAAHLRDQILLLRRLQEKQVVFGDTGDADILAVAVRDQLFCVQVLFIRQGRVLGSNSYFPQTALDAEPAEVLAAFIGQFYLDDQEIPFEILLDRPLPASEHATLEQCLIAKAGHAVRLASNLIGERGRWLELSAQNARLALMQKLLSRDQLGLRYDSLQQALGLSEWPKRMECFDISHTQGEGTVASCVVFDRQGPKKSLYRRFNIDGIQPGDDYAAMQQALERRFKRLKAEQLDLPDILLIDGGLGQLARAREVLDGLAIDQVLMVAVAKGPDRKPGKEQLFVGPDAEPLSLPSDSPALHLIQQIRDEAHRFAVAGHRARRAKSRRRSSLENLPGVGPKRRQALLTFFGGLQELTAASQREIAKVPGISVQLAQRIYAMLHPSEQEDLFLAEDNG